MSLPSNYVCEGQMSIFDIFSQDTWSGRTSQEPSVQTKERTSKQSLKKQRKSAIKMPLFLDLRGGRWTPSGCIMGDGWSIAWRVHDAQFWGVPQRRKRIALVADFGGQSAPQILFESEGLSGNFEESREEGQEIAGVAEENIDKAISFQERAGKPGGGKGILIQHERTGALSTLNNQSVLSVDEKMGQTYIGDNVGNTLGARDYKQPQAVVYGLCSDGSNAMKSSNPHSGIYEAETTRTLDNNGGNPACNQGGMIVLEGNGQRDSHKGDRYKESETICAGNR